MFFYHKFESQSVKPLYMRNCDVLKFAPYRTPQELQCFKIYSILHGNLQQTPQFHKFKMQCTEKLLAIIIKINCTANKYNPWHYSSFCSFFFSIPGSLIYCSEISRVIKIQTGLHTTKKTKCCSQSYEDIIFTIL